jgi:PBSX family phage terminase large subunit
MKEIQATVEMNEKFIPLLTDRSRHKVLLGSAGSGKSHAVAQYVLLNFISLVGANVLIIRKIYESIGMSVFPLLQHCAEKMKIGHLIRENKMEHSLYCLANGNVMKTAGMNDDKRREKLKSVTAPNGPFSIIWVEEATELDLYDYAFITPRLRGPLDRESVEKGLHKQIILTFNPVNINHWIKKEFALEMDGNNLSSRKQNVYALKTTVDDNYWATQEDIDELDKLKEIDPYFYEVYRLGNWGVIGEHSVVIPYALLWKHRQNKIETPVGQFDIGIDPARYGDDNAVIYMRQGNKKIDKRRFAKSNGYDLANAATDMIRQHRADERKKVRIKIDAGGVGASCIDILKERCENGNLKNVEVYEINFGGRPKDQDLYKNTITEMYYEARDMIPFLDWGFWDHGEEKLVSDITRRRYKILEGKDNTLFCVESKDDFKKRNGGESPDDGDACVLCLYDPPSPRTPTIILGRAGGE